MSWTILVRAATGAVSLMQNLTERDAREVLQRLQPQTNPWTTESINRRLRQAVTPIAPSNGFGGGGWVSAGIAQQAYLDPTPSIGAECWASDDAQLDIWPKPDDYDERYERALVTAQLVEETNQEIRSRRAA